MHGYHNGNVVSMKMNLVAVAKSASYRTQEYYNIMTRDMFTIVVRTEGRTLLLQSTFMQ